MKKGKKKGKTWQLALDPKLHLKRRGGGVGSRVQGLLIEAGTGKHWVDGFRPPTGTKCSRRGKGP